jgi:putative solute:sodium symporter small subunit
MSTVSPATEAHREEYWQRTLRLTAILLAVWFVVTYVAGFFARELNAMTMFGFPVGFYIAAQGALIVYVVIIGYYARVMNRRDVEFGLHEDEEE